MKKVSPPATRCSEENRDLAPSEKSKQHHPYISSSSVKERKPKISITVWDPRDEALAP